LSQGTGEKASTAGNCQLYSIKSSSQTIHKHSKSQLVFTTHIFWQRFHPFLDQKFSFAIPLQVK
jgi:hypothetical protein